MINVSANDIAGGGMCPAAQGDNLDWCDRAKDHFDGEVRHTLSCNRSGTNGNARSSHPRTCSLLPVQLLHVPPYLPSQPRRSSSVPPSPSLSPMVLPTLRLSWSGWVPQHTASTLTNAVCLSPTSKGQEQGVIPYASRTTPGYSFQARGTSLQ